ncbi:pseudouridylate synthase TRUB2, mitochondrial-like [Ptychodera flava]|uniref:pseudouridylate synthase TRUB2, mitochondrial-like n=1 Tax=Ptychodera flava TaxID=63121 RepID=UPI003969FB84
MRSKLAEVAYRGLNGVFAVYKPPGMAALQVKTTVQLNLLKDLNSLKQRPLKTMVKILRDTGQTDETKALTVTEVPSLADHPLAIGPRYQDIGIRWLTPLDRMASGIMVMAVEDGTRKLGMLHAAQFPSVYEIKGRLGIATDTFDDTGKVIEKATHHHVTREKIDRVVAAMMRVHQSAMTRFSGVDMQSQEAYELAVRGLLRPSLDKLPPIILRMKCLHFENPDFTIEMECVKEEGAFLRKMAHEIGLEMKSAAVATQVRRISQGPFNLEHALLKKHWKLDYISEAIQICKPLVKKKKVLPYYKMKRTLPEEVFKELKETEAKLDIMKKRTTFLESGDNAS